MRIGMMLAAGLVGAGVLVGCTTWQQMTLPAAGVEAAKVRGVEEKAAELRVGMTREEVIALLGKPYKARVQTKIFHMTPDGLFIAEPVKPLTGLEGVVLEEIHLAGQELHYRRADGSTLIVYFDLNWRHIPEFEASC